MLRSSLRPSLLVVCLLGFESQAQVSVLPPTRVPGDGERVALVIGNGRYQHRSPDLADLPASTNDATDLAEALRGFGFTVHRGLNLTRSQIEREVEVFGDRARGAKAALFFYSGHGMQSADGASNYLIPSGASPRSTNDLPTQGVDLRSALRSVVGTDRPPELALVLIDACRTRLPTRGRRGGVAGYTPDWDEEIDDHGTGTIVVFAAQPGLPAFEPVGVRARANGHFTRAVLDVMESDPDLSIHQFFPRVKRLVRQRTDREQDPDIDTEFSGEFAFSVGGRPVRTPDRGRPARREPSPNRVAPLPLPTSVLPDGATFHASAELTGSQCESARLADDTRLWLDLLTTSLRSAPGPGLEYAVAIKCGLGRSLRASPDDADAGLSIAVRDYFLGKGVRVADETFTIRRVEDATQFVQDPAKNWVVILKQPR